MCMNFLTPSCIKKMHGFVREYNCFCHKRREYIPGLSQGSESHCGAYKYHILSQSASHFLTDRGGK